MFIKAVLHSIYNIFKNSLDIKFQQLNGGSIILIFILNSSKEAKNLIF